MSKPGLVAVVGMVGLGLAVVVHRAGGQDQPTARPATAEFAGKFVVVGFKIGDQPSNYLLQDVKLQRLGGREFLVGRVVVGDDRAADDWRGVMTWVPVDGIGLMLVFDDRDKAIRAGATAWRGGR